jgi:hypothetical protein
MKDLLCAVADKNMEAAVASLLERHDAIGIREVSFDVLVHPRRDPGLFREGVEILRRVKPSYSHALILLDASWDGAPPDIQTLLDRALHGAGFGEWARAIVIAPELEVWVWSESPHVERILGWSGRSPGLREWLEQRRLWTGGSPKPADPKKAVEAALCQVGKPRSSAIYRALASEVSLERCHDPAFRRLRESLREWFGVEA